MVSASIIARKSKDGSVAYRAQIRKKKMVSRFTHKQKRIAVKKDVCERMSQSCDCSGGTTKNWRSNLGSMRWRRVCGKIPETYKDIFLPDIINTSP